MTDMKPENTNIPRVPEGLPSVEAPQLDRLPPLPTSAEAGLGVGGERYEQVAELSAAQADATSTAVPATQMTTTSVVDDTTTASASAPLIAANNDVIEKEWVDRAKKIITDTKDDPNKREQQVGGLRKDYLRKRYGKELGAAS